MRFAHAALRASPYIPTALVSGSVVTLYKSPHSFPNTPRPKVSGRWAKERQVWLIACRESGCGLPHAAVTEILTEHEQN